MAATVVIQCAASKEGGYLRGPDGVQVGFVAQPERAMPKPGWLFAHPDDHSSSGECWRDVLSAYNDRWLQNGHDPDHLRPAWQLYTNRAFSSLVQAFGQENVYVLSAGWGLVRAAYLLPNYDITFSSQADAVSVRRPADAYDDFEQMAVDIAGPVHFLGGRSYLPLFCRLTDHVNAERIVYYNSMHLPVAPGCRLVRFRTTTRTNWHYECAHRLIADRVV